MLENLMKKQNLFSNEKDIERLRVKSSQYYAKDMKMKSDFVVPISHQMLEVLESVKPLSCASVYVFPSDISKTKQMSENTLNYAIKRMGFGEEMVFHGFRATASTLLHENTPNHKIASEVIELCLDHKERNKGVVGDVGWAKILPSFTQFLTRLVLLLHFPNQAYTCKDNCKNLDYGMGILYGQVHAI